MADLKTRRELIASRFKLARENAGLSQGQVASLLKIPRPSVSEAEAGRRKVAAEELTEVATLCGVSVAWLAGEGTESVDTCRDRIDLAARELNKLKPEDVDRIISLLSAMRTGSEVR
jgi:transcriptional regulator with XRE-family HTH domain